MEHGWNFRRNVTGSAVVIRKALLQSGCALHHEITNVGGLDPLILVNSESNLMMIANVHLDPSSTQGTSKKASHYLHWRSDYPPRLGSRFNVVDPIFSDGNPGRTAIFRSIFPHAL